MFSQTSRSGPATDRPDPPMITRPPKPPSWRDFQAEAKESQAAQASPPRKSERRAKELLGFSSLSLTQRSRSEGTDISRLGVASTLVLAENRAATLPHLKQQRKHKNRLHRTRSQYSIEKTDLPEKSQMAMSIAEAKPNEIGLRSKRPVDDRVYMDENTRRCEKWLAGVRASQKAFTQEIPEENMSDQDSAKPSSAAGKDKVRLEAQDSLLSPTSLTGKSRIPVPQPQQPQPQQHSRKSRPSKEKQRQLSDEQICAKILSQRRKSVERIIADTIKRRSGSYDDTRQSNGNKEGEGGEKEGGAGDGQQ